MGVYSNETSQCFEFLPVETTAQKSLHFLHCLVIVVKEARARGSFKVESQIACILCKSRHPRLERGCKVTHPRSPLSLLWGNLFGRVKIFKIGKFDDFFKNESIDRDT